MFCVFFVGGGGGGGGGGGTRLNPATSTLVRAS